MNLFNLFFALFILVSCNGKRNIDEQSRLEKVDPHLVEDKAILMSSCRTRKADTHLALHSILSQEFALEKFVEIRFSEICSAPDEKTCKAECAYPVRRVNLSKLSFVDEVVQDNEIKVDSTCEKYVGSVCHDYLISSSINDGINKKIKNYKIQKLGRFVMTTKVAQENIIENEGEIWRVHELGAMKINLFLSKELSEKINKKFTFNLLKSDDGIESSFGGLLKVALPSRLSSGEILDFSKVNLNLGINRIKDKLVKIKTKVKLFDQQKTVPMTIEMEVDLND